MVIAAVGAVGALALLPVISAQGTARSPSASPHLVSTRHLPGQEPGARPPGVSLTGCENELDRARRGDIRPAPRLAVVGASFTAGVGSGRLDKSWAVLLARLLHWDAVVYGDPGAGYVRPGVGHKGPVADEIARVDLRALAPALVIVQAGHDDIGTAPRLERQRVEQAVALIRAEAPRARIALLTVFAGPARSPAAYRSPARWRRSCAGTGCWPRRRAPRAPPSATPGYPPRRRPVTAPIWPGPHPGSELAGPAGGTGSGFPGRAETRPGPCRRGFRPPDGRCRARGPSRARPGPTAPGRSGRRHEAGRRARYRVRGRAR